MTAARLSSAGTASGRKRGSRSRNEWRNEWQVAQRLDQLAGTPAQPGQARVRRFYHVNGDEAVRLGTAGEVNVARLLKWQPDHVARQHPQLPEYLRRVPAIAQHQHIPHAQRQAQG